jgi:predicted hydrocarbon binding protein
MEQPAKRVHNVAYFIAALAHGAEQNLGRGSLSICSRAGKRFGLEAVTGTEQTDDPVRAVEILREALAREGIVWDFSPFAGDRGDPVTIDDDGTRRMRLVFRTCMVRNALFCYCHDQKQSLCYMAHGVFAGAMEQVMPAASVDLVIVHAGPNACLKEMVWTVEGSPA